MNLSTLRPGLAVRLLRRAPGFSIAAVVLLGLGIGMSTAMFTVYRAVLVQRLPVADQDRVVVLHPLDRGGAHLDVPLPYLGELRRDSRTMRGIAGVYHLGGVPTPMLQDGTPIDSTASMVSANLFDVLGTHAMLGRMPRASDADKGAPKVLVLSADGWRRIFHEDSSIVGRTLVDPYDQTQVTIVGVAPPGLPYPAGVDAWQPAAPDFAEPVDVIARLAPGATVDNARSELLAIARRVNPFLGADNTLFRPSIAGVEGHQLAQDMLDSVRPALVAWTAAVALLLVIACANVGTLLLVRGAGRGREFAVRRAIGAGAQDLAAQLLLENGLLGAAGGAFGLLLAEGLLRLLVSLAPAQLPGLDVIRASGAPLGVAAGLSILATLLVGLVPAFAAARADPARASRSDARVGGGAPHRRARRWLVSSQVALAVVVLAGASLLARSLAHLQQINLGYAPDHLSLLQFTGPQSVFTTVERAVQVADQLEERLRTLPGVIALTDVESPPFKGQSLFLTKMARADLSAPELEASPYIPFEVAGVDDFRTFQIPIVRGRAFLDSDTKSSPKVVIVSEALAKREWPGQDAVGQHLRDAYDTSGALYTVVGVAGDTHFRDLRAVAPVIYEPWQQLEGMSWWGLFAVRTSDDIETVLPSIRRAVTETAPGVVIVHARTMVQLLDGPLAQPRLTAFLLSGFGLVALVLAAIGLYGAMSSAVCQRSREIGIRVALGATVSRIRGLVPGEAMLVVGIGLVAGVLAPS